MKIGDPAPPPPKRHCPHCPYYLVPLHTFTVPTKSGHEFKRHFYLYRCVHCDSLTWISVFTQNGEIME